MGADGRELGYPPGRPWVRVPPPPPAPSYLSRIESGFVIQGSRVRVPPGAPHFLKLIRSSASNGRRAENQAEFLGAKKMSGENLPPNYAPGFEKVIPDGSPSTKPTPAF
jgi:hypothetical protein